MIGLSMIISGKLTLITEVFATISSKLQSKVIEVSTLFCKLFLILTDVKKSFTVTKTKLLSQGKLLKVQ